MRALAVVVVACLGACTYDYQGALGPGTSSSTGAGATGGGGSGAAGSGGGGTGGAGGTTGDGGHGAGGAAGAGGGCLCAPSDACETKAAYPHHATQTDPVMDIVGKIRWGLGFGQDPAHPSECRPFDMTQIAAALGQDDNLQPCVHLLDGGSGHDDTSTRLTVDQFGITFPQGQAFTVTGVKVFVRKKSNHTHVKDGNGVRLVFGGGSEDFVVNTNWPTSYPASPSYYVYTGPMPQQAQVSADDFGFSLRATNTDTTDPAIAHIDSISVTVGYADMSCSH